MFSLAAIGSTIANNRAAQWALGAGLLIAGFLFWLAQHDKSVLRNYNLRAERKTAEEKARATEHLNTIEKEASNEADQAIEAGNAARSTGIDGMSDDAIARTFGRSRV